MPPCPHALHGQQLVWLSDAGGAEPAVSTAEGQATARRVRTHRDLLHAGGHSLLQPLTGAVTQDS